jgi:hypothetical protein
MTCIRSRCVGDVFEALADPTRRTILDELIDRNGQTLVESGQAVQGGAGGRRRPVHRIRRR